MPDASQLVAATLQTPPGERGMQSRSAVVVEFCLASLLTSLIVYASFQRSIYVELANIPVTTLSALDRVLLNGSITATSTIALFPALALGSMLALLRWFRAAVTAFVGLASLGVLVILVDLDLFRSIGRHVSEILTFAALPGGHHAAGELGHWGMSLTKWGIVSLGLVLACTFMSRVLARFGRRRVGRRPFVMLVSSSITLILLLVALPSASRSLWQRQGAAERLYGALFFDFRLRGDEDRSMVFGDPVLDALRQQLAEVYREEFSRIFRRAPVDTRSLADAFAAKQAPRPNVILIVAESFRADAFGPELMPRLSRWAENGIVAKNHDSGTIYSESGLFALLYGRNPLVFHATLDQGARAQLCEMLRPAGYTCGFYTGHPEIWKRREEFLNRKTMDFFVHDDEGTWPEWDRKAMDNMVKAIDRQTKPSFSIALLMSSHFEYQYPPQYEIDLPVSDTTWGVTELASLGPEAAWPHRNRYRNTMRFLDDAIADTIGRLAPEKNIIILVGDHGESIYDDGRYTHGYSFGEMITRTPFAMVGPGVPKKVIETPTLHVDLVPTLADVLGDTTLDGVHGTSMLDPEERKTQLEAYCATDTSRAFVQLRAMGHRLLLRLSLQEPDVLIRQVDDVLGEALDAHGIQMSEVPALAEAFRTELQRLSR